MTGIREPFIPEELEDVTEVSPEFYANVLRALACQLTYRNDYYVTLMDLAGKLDGKTPREATGPTLWRG